MPLQPRTMRDKRIYLGHSECAIMAVANRPRLSGHSAVHNTHSAAKYTKYCQLSSAAATEHSTAYRRKCDHHYAAAALLAYVTFILIPTAGVNLFLQTSKVL